MGENRFYSSYRACKFLNRDYIIKISDVTEHVIHQEIGLVFRFPLSFRGFISFGLLFTCLSENLPSNSPTSSFLPVIVSLIG